MYTDPRGWRFFYYKKPFTKTVKKELYLVIGYYKPSIKSKYQSTNALGLKYIDDETGWRPMLEIESKAVGKALKK